MRIFFTPLRIGPFFHVKRRPATKFSETLLKFRTQVESFTTQ